MTPVALNKGIRSILTVTLLASLSACSIHVDFENTASSARNQNECVVLVHGLWRSGFAMNNIANYLERKGYQTVSIDYPSTDLPIPELAETYLSTGIQQCETTGAEITHLVSHSMGGVLIRQYLQDHTLPDQSKVVMLSPPNQGSQLSETFGDSWWYKWFVGPAGSSLTKNSNGIINQLKAVDAEVGVIAAQRNWSFWPESWLPSPNDGTISVENMKLPEMKDFILVNSGHSMMRYNAEIQDQIQFFLSKGVFNHSSSL